MIEQPRVETPDGEWTKVIVPQRGWLDIPWRELWRYRDLMTLMAKRDLAAQYKQTVLGPLWFVIQPLLATAVFSVLFGRLAGLGTNHIPHFLFYMAGLLAWGYFADIVHRTSHTFTKNSAIFSKVYFPRLIVPFGVAIRNLSTFAVQFAVFLAGLFFYLWKAKWDTSIHLHPNWMLALLPVFMLQIAMLGLGVGLIISSLTTKYRDLALAVGFGLQLWMYASSVVFPLSRVEGKFRMLLSLNPMVPTIEGIRLGFLGSGIMTWSSFAISLTVSAVVFVIGLIMFTRTEQTVMDTI